MHEITELLQAWKCGDMQALDRLMPLVDPELKKIAHNYMRNESRENILQTTATTRSFSLASSASAS